MTIGTKESSDILWERFKENPCDETRNDFFESYAPYVHTVSNDFYCRMGCPGNTSAEEFKSLAFDKLFDYLDKPRDKKPSANKIKRLIIDGLREEGSFRRGGGLRRICTTEFECLKNRGNDYSGIETNDFFEGVCKGLDIAEKMLIKMRYIEGMFFKEIGNAIGVGKDRARKIHENVLEKLRESFGVRKFY